MLQQAPHERQINRDRHRSYLSREMGPIGPIHGPSGHKEKQMKLSEIIEEMEKPPTPKQREEFKKWHNEHWNSDFEKAYRAGAIKDDDED